MRAARQRARARVAGALLVALLAACGPTEPSEPRAPVEPTPTSPTPDAGPAQASPAPAAPSPTVEAPPTEEVLLARDVAHLEALLEGNLPENVEPRTLFLVDLLDEAACDARVATLRASLGRAPPPVDAGMPMDAGVPLVDAGALDGALALPDGALPTGALPEAGVPPDGGAGTADAGVPATGEGADAGPRPDGGAPIVDAGAPEEGSEPEASAGPTPEAHASTIDALRRRRDELRLAFLELPEGERRALLRAVEVDRAFSRRAAEARAAELEAEDERRVAEAERAEAELRAAGAATVAEQRREARRAEVAAVRAAIAEALAVAAAARVEDAESERERAARVHRIEARLREELAPERAAALYDELVALLVAMRRDLRAALDATPEPLPSLEGDTEDAPDVAAEVAAARASRAEALATLDRLAWEHVEALAEALHDGNDIRLTLLERLPSARADALQTILHDEGRAQLRREISQLELMSRYAVRHVRRTAPGWPAAILALGSEPRSRRDLFGLFALIGVVVFAFRRRLAFVDSLEEASTQRIDSRHLRRVAQAWFGRLRVGAGPLVLLAGSGVAFALVLDIRHTAEVELLRTLVLAFLAYRLFVRLLHHELTRGPVRRIGSRRVRVRAPTARSQRVLFDVRRVGRYFFALVVTLGAAQRVVGEGTLYAELVRVFALVGLVLTYVLLRRWRDDIARAFAESHPDSRLGSRLADASGLRLDALAAVAAVELGVRQTLEALRTFVARFAAGRRAMAMLSRRRLEQRQGAEPEAEEPPEPREKPQLAEAFPLGPAPLESCVDHFPELDAIAELVGRVKDGGRGAAVALVGEAGAGKTTWLRALVDRTEAKTWCLEAPPAAHDQSILCRWLSEQLELPETESPARLAQEIEEAELRGLICVDAGENLFLRCIGGTEGFRALGEIVGRTQEQLVWVCAFSANGWRYLRAAEAGQSLFGRVVALEGWSEEEIADLVERRMRKLGLRADFGALLDTAGAPGTTLAEPARQRALERTRGEFFQLLWDATDGNPRLVAHFWLRSLQRDEETGELRVRLFEAPSLSELEALHDESRFLLAAVVVHEDLSAGEAALVLRWPIARCAALLDVLAARGFLMEEEERPGRFRIAVQWFRAILRHLRRRRLLPPS